VCVCVCVSSDTDCRVEPHPCERRTLETVRELAGNALCWRGSRQADTVLALPCPFYRLVHRVCGQSPHDSECSKAAGGLALWVPMLDVAGQFVTEKNGRQKKRSGMEFSIQQRGTLSATAELSGLGRGSGGFGVRWPVFRSQAFSALAAVWRETPGTRLFQEW
jgi:hypothetical protein